MLRVALAVLLIALPAGVCAADEPALKISLAIPLHHQQRSLNDGGHFHVLVTNVSDGPVRLWSDRYSWGYGNLSFESIDDNGNVTRIAKLPRDWGKNYPDWLELAAGESYVLNVDWTSEAGRALWDGPPGAAGKQRPTLVKLRGVYEVLPDDQSRKLGVWTGKITSPVGSYAVW